MVLLCFYPEILRAIDQAAELCNQALSKSGQHLEERDVAFHKSKGLWSSMALQKGFKFSKLWTLKLEVWVEWIKYLLFLTTDFIFHFGKAGLILLLPVMIFLGQMFSLFGWGSLLGIFFLLSLWPLGWNLVGQLSGSLRLQPQPGLSGYLYSLLLSLLQFGAPLKIMQTIKQSGITSVAMASLQALSTLGQNAKTFAQGTAGTLTKMPAQGKVGYVASYATNQILSRMISAGKSGVQEARAPSLKSNEKSNASENGPILLPVARAVLKGAVLNGGFRRKPLMAKEAESV